MAAFVLKINGGEHRVDVDPQTPLLWAIRDGAGLMGTKYGRGVAQGVVRGQQQRGRTQCGAGTPADRRQAGGGFLRSRQGGGPVAAEGVAAGRRPE